MGKLVLLRHGESQWNLENKFTGWVDVDVSARGVEEAHRAAQLLKGIGFDVAYCSGLLRAKRTLELVLGDLGLSKLRTVYDKALNERHYGDLQGLNKAETAKKYGEKQVHIWRRSYDVRPPGGESLEDTANRTLPFFDKRILADVKEGKNVLVSAHGNSLRAIVMDLDRLTKEQVTELNIATATPIVYDIDASGKVLKKAILLPPALPVQRSQDARAA
jgi:2,3-bisphosphoglycerate-dependent phosphoglycerate mutase